MSQPSPRCRRLVPLTRCAQLAAGMLAAAVAAGCAPPNRIVLVQPTAPPAQQRLELATRWVFFDQAGDRVRALLAYPLPGSLDGPRDFLLYLDLPAGGGRLAVDSSSGGATGFLIQRKGFRRGKAVFAGGTVDARRRWLNGRVLDLRLDVECDDRTRVVGRAALRLDEREMGEFAARYAADIGSLASRERVTSQPATFQAAVAGGALASPPTAPIIATP